MGQSVWNGKRWRRVSDVEARLRRAQGQTVRVDAPAPPPPAPQPVAKLAELPPARKCSKCGESGHTARTCKATGVFPLTANPQGSTGVPKFDVSDEKPLVTDSPAELTEAELERLTAPGGGEG
jgi:hypothetical protein